MERNFFGRLRAGVAGRAAALAIGALLCFDAAFCGGLLLLPQGIPQEVQAAAATKTVYEPSKLGENVNTASAAYLFFGGFCWRVIGYNGSGAASESGRITLLAPDIMGQTKFGSSSSYGDSNLRAKMDEIYENINSEEKYAVVDRTLPASRSVNTSLSTDWDTILGSSDCPARLWPLSVKEASQLDASLRNLDEWYWLRTPGDNYMWGEYVQAVRKGQFTVEMPDSIFSRNGGVRPAFYLDTDDILFTDGSVLTLYDGSLSAFFTYPEIIDANTVSLNYWAEGGADHLLVFTAPADSPDPIDTFDAARSVTYIPISGEEGKVTYTVPGGTDALKNESAYIYVAAAQVHETNVSDFAGDFDRLYFLYDDDEDDDEIIGEGEIDLTPKPIHLKENGTEQKLVTEGKAKQGKKIVYALGEDSKTQPGGDKFTEEVPKAKNKGVYHVWFKVEGSSHVHHTAVRIAAAETTPKGTEKPIEKFEPAQGDSTSYPSPEVKQETTRSGSSGSSSSSSHSPDSYKPIQIGASGAGTQGGAAGIPGRGGMVDPAKLKAANAGKSIQADSIAAKVNIRDVNALIDALMNETNRKNLMLHAMNNGLADVTVAASNANGGKTKIATDKATVLLAVMSAQEMVDLFAGYSGKMTAAFSVDEARSIAETDRAAVEGAKTAAESVHYFEMNMALAAGDKSTAVTEFAVPLSFTVEIPGAIRGAESYRVVASHKDAATGQLQALSLADTDTDPDTVTVSSDKLCVCAFAYTGAAAGAAGGAAGRDIAPKMADLEDFEPMLFIFLFIGLQLAGVLCIVRARAK